MTLRPSIGRPSLTSLPALSHRNYRLFFGGQLISLIGTWMTTVAQAWLILQLTGDPFDLGLVAVAQFGPVLILGLFGGLIADSLPKRRTMYVTQTVAMFVSFALFFLAASGRVQTWQVFVLAAVMGVRNSVDMPTRQAFAVEMVGPVAVRPAATHPAFREPALAVNVTVPVGALDRVPVTVAVRVTAVPYADGLADEVTATVETPVELTTRVAELAKPAVLGVIGA